MIASLKKRYLESNVTQGFVALYTGKTISNIAISLFGMFLPIFLYKLYGGDFNFVALYFLVGYLLYGFSIPFGAFFLNHHGFNRSLRLSTFFGASTFVLLYFVTPANAWYLIPVQILATTIYRLLFWLPYHVDFAEFSDANKRGSEIGVFEATLNIIGVVTPLLAGFIITQYGFGVLFIIATMIFLLSLIPYHFIPEIREKFTWTYRQTVRQLFAKKHRGITLAFMADGAEEVVGFIVWPIVIYELLKGNILQIGIISTIVVGSTIVLQLFVGRHSNERATQERILRYGSFFASLAWLLKIFVITALQIFVVDAYHKLTKIMMRIPFAA
ncbi:MAG: Major facilitator superfamily, partial [Candidatus Wolfebacteria bacterium GW2011_GWA1_47_6]